MENTVTMDAVLKKLQVKAPRSFRIVNAQPDVSLAPIQGERPEVTLVFARNKKELGAHVPKQIAPDDILWVAYPKGSAKVPTDLNRDILHAEMAKRGFDGVSLVSVDATWSAMRFKLLG